MSNPQLLKVKATNPALKDPGVLRLPTGGAHDVALDYDDTFGYTEETALGVVCDNLNELLEKSGLPHRLNREEFIEQFPGRTHPQIFTEVRERFQIPQTTPGWNDTDIDLFDREATASVIAAFRGGKLRGAPGIDVLLEGLADSDAKFCVVSSSPLVRLQACVEGLHHEKYCMPLFSARKDPHGSLKEETPKPHRAVYDLATDGLPDNWIAVEDSVNGMKSAANAQILKRIGFVGCIRPDRHEQRAKELFEVGALIVVRDHTEVLEVFKQFNEGKFGAVLAKHGPQAWGFSVAE